MLGNDDRWSSSLFIGRFVPSLVRRLTRSGIDTTLADFAADAGGTSVKTIREPRTAQSEGRLARVILTGSTRDNAADGDLTWYTLTHRAIPCSFTSMELTHLLRSKPDTSTNAIPLVGRHSFDDARRM